MKNFNYAAAFCGNCSCAAGREEVTTITNPLNDPSAEGQMYFRRTHGRRDMHQKNCDLSKPSKQRTGIS